MFPINSPVFVLYTLNVYPVLADWGIQTVLACSIVWKSARTFVFVLIANTCILSPFLICLRGLPPF